MKKLNRKSSRGFTLIELMVALVILGVLIAALQPLFSRGNDSKNSKIIVDDIMEINAAAKAFKGSANDYTGLSLANLITNGLLEAGAATNPVAGTYTAAPSGANVLITATGMTTGMCDTVRRRLVNGAVSATCAAGTISVTYR